MKVCVHRKGATRAFGPGAPELPAEYSKIGQPVLVPGSMGTASWVSGRHSNQYGAVFWLYLPWSWTDYEPRQSQETNSW
jgi:hypothetical protein